MKPNKIPAELNEKQLSEIFRYMRRRGFSIGAHIRRSAASEADDCPATWNLGDAEMAEYIGIAPNTMRKILVDDPSVKWTTIEKVASFFLKELEPGSSLRYDWLHLVENRWNALQSKDGVDQTQVLNSGSETGGGASIDQLSISSNSAFNSPLWMTGAFVVTLAVMGVFYFDLHTTLLAVAEPEEDQSETASVVEEPFLVLGVQAYTKEQHSQKIDMVLASALDSFKGPSDGATRIVLSNMIQDLHARKIDSENDYERFVTDLLELDVSLNQLEEFYDEGEIELARAALRLGDTSKVEDIWKEVLSDSEKDLAQFGDRAARAAIVLGDLQVAEFRWLEGAGYYRRVAEISPSIDNLTRAGVFLWRIGDYTGAEHFEREVAQIVRDQSSPDSDELAGALSSLGVTLAALGKFEEAEDLYIEALGIRRSILPPEASALMKTVNNYCNTLIALDRLEEATVYCNEALDVRRAQKDANPYSYAISLIVSSGLEKKAGNFATAESYLREAADIARLDEAYWGPRSPRYAQAIYQLGLLLDQMGEFTEAEALIEESIDIVQSLNGELSPDLYIRKSSLAKVRAALGAGQEALALATHSLTNLEFLFGDPNHPDVIDAKRNLEKIQSDL